MWGTYVLEEKGFEKMALVGKRAVDNLAASASKDVENEVILIRKVIANSPSQRANSNEHVVLEMLRTLKGTICIDIHEMLRTLANPPAPLYGHNKKMPASTEQMAYFKYNIVALRWTSFFEQFTVICLTHCTYWKA